MIVDSTALPEQAVASVIESAFQSAGQRCSALRVLYVQEDIYDKFLTMLKGAMDLLVCDTPWQLSSDVGPLIDSEAFNSINGYIQSKQASVLHQTAANDTQDTNINGYFIPSTLIEVNGIADLDHEVFGPVLHLAKYKAGNFFKVIEDINASGVFTPGWMNVYRMPSVQLKLATFISTAIKLVPLSSHSHSVVKNSQALALKPVDHITYSDF